MFLAENRLIFFWKQIRSVCCFSMTALFADNVNFSLFFVCRTSPAAIIRIPHGNCQRASPLSLKLLDCRIYERRTPRCRGNSRPCQDEVGVFGQLASLYCKSPPCPPDPSTKMLTSLMRPLNKKWRDILPRLGRNVYMTSPLTLHHIRRWFMF